MEFRILGPLEVIGADGPLTLRGAKRRGLLAFLLVHRGQVIPSDRLAEARALGGAQRAHARLARHREEPRQLHQSRLGAQGGRLHRRQQDGAVRVFRG